MSNLPIVESDAACPPSAMSASERVALYTLLRDCPLAQNVLAVLANSTAKASAADRNSLIARGYVRWSRRGPCVTGIGRMVAMISVQDDAIALKVQGALSPPHQYAPGGYTVPQSTW